MADGISREELQQELNALEGRLVEKMRDMQAEITRALMELHSVQQKPGRVPEKNFLDCMPRGG